MLIPSNSTPSNKRLTISLAIMIIGLTILSVTFIVLWAKKDTSSSSSDVYAVEKGIIGFPIRLPDDGRYVQWTFLQLNDVYEMLPLDNGKKGGLARVAHLRKLLKQENSNTYTFFAGDLVSPSALSQSIVNGTTLNGRQMIASMNTLGVDYMTFGNHEFDLSGTDLIARMTESNFTWVCSNVFDPNTNRSFASSIPYKILEIESVRILIFGLTIYQNKSYVRIIDEPELIPFAKQFIQSLSNEKYDVLIGLTHLSIDVDRQVLESIPEIDLIMGGHEHEDFYLFRGSNYSPISKADGNAFSVYIHRCAFNLDTKKFRIYSTLALVTPEVPDDVATRDVVNYWYNLGIKGFEAMGFEPNKTVSCLPAAIELDGRSASVRNFPTLLTNLTCEALLFSTQSNRTEVGVYNTGGIRIDDILRGIVTQYDILRTLPFQNNLYSLSVPGDVLARVLTKGMALRGDGMFLSYCGVETSDQGTTWIINGDDITKTGLNYKVATISFAKDNTDFKDPSVTVIHSFNTTQTFSLIDFLPTKYSPICPK